MVALFRKRGNRRGPELSLIQGEGEEIEMVRGWLRRDILKQRISSFYERASTDTRKPAVRYRQRGNDLKSEDESSTKD